MKKQETYEQIEAYLAGFMSSQEKADFEKALEGDDRLKNEVEFHRELAEATKGENFHKLRDVLQKTDASWTGEKGHSGGRVISMSFMKMAIAASVVVLMGVALWFNITSSTDGPELFAAHFEPYDMVITQRSLEGPKDQVLETAINNYDDGNYQESEKQFSNLAEINPDEPIMRIYECISSLATGNSKSSIDCFDNLLNIPALAEQSRWYLGLAYLQDGNGKKAAEVLSQIGEKEYKYAEAKEILNLIN